ncbi:MAG: FprA family A-type flavoprotein [Clostridia bacterium]|nr:FprA family A-type flavoprotein [Clostridia bacterium]
MTITNDIRYIGVNDHDIDLFEGQYIVPEGMAYNSYVIIDEKIAVMDTVSADFGEKWLANLENVLAGRKPDYLIIHHMEPDHSANIDKFISAYPEATVVGNAKTFEMIDQFFGSGLCKNRLAVKNGEMLSLGRHELTFLFAPMVHWPEVMMSYDGADKALFSADAFGKFGALDCQDKEWDCEARRYYMGIVGKYGMQVQAVLKKAAALDIKMICPLHGPVLTGDLSHYMSLYDIWSSYGVESEGVCIAYTSVYGNTKKAAELLAKKLEERGCKAAISDLARCDMAEAVEDAFRYGKLVLATTTYNADIFPFMRQFIDHLTERNYQNRTIGFIENGTWAPAAAKIMKAMFEKSRNINYIDTTVTLRSAMTEENAEAIERMAEELCR